MKIKRIVTLILVFFVLFLFLYFSVGCTYTVEPSSYRPAKILPKEVYTYKSVGKRYHYVLTVEKQGVKWNKTIRGICFAPDESLPSRNFVGVDYGFDGPGLNTCQFMDKNPSSKFERQLVFDQASRAISMTERPKNLVSVNKL